MVGAGAGGGMGNKLEQLQLVEFASSTLGKGVAKDFLANKITNG